MFGITLNDTEIKVIGLFFSGCVLLVGYLTRGGRKADQETKAKETIEGPETQSMSLRDLVVETFRKSGAAEESAAGAATAAKKLQSTTEGLGSQIAKNHEGFISEVARLDGRIDDVFARATRAEQLARAASGDRKSDEALRSASAATPPSGAPAVTQGTEVA